MDRKKVDVVWLCVSIVSYFLMSVTFVLMPLDPLLSALEDRTAAVLVGAGFWGFMLIGTLAQIVLASRWRASRRAQRPNDKNSFVRKVGILSFGANIPAVIADIGMLIALCGFIVSVIFTNATGYICYIFLSIFSFAFCMHCILNGKIYNHITHPYRSNGKYLRVDTISEHQKTEGEQ